MTSRHAYIRNRIAISETSFNQTTLFVVNNFGMKFVENICCILFSTESDQTIRVYLFELVSLQGLIVIKCNTSKYFGLQT